MVGRTVLEVYLFVVAGWLEGSRTCNQKILLARALATCDRFEVLVKHDLRSRHLV